MTLKRSYVINPNYEKRHENDYYPTAPLAVECLLDRYNEHIPNDLYEPAAGRGWISKTLKDHGYSVKSSDLNKYENPLVDDIEFDIDYLRSTIKSKGVTTNPPYMRNLPAKFLEKALAENEFVAFFLRLTFMEGVSRYRLFRENPPDVLVFSRRMNCQEEKFDTYQGQIGGMVAYAWFIWGKDIPGNRITWIDAQDVIGKKHNNLSAFIEEN